MTPIWYLVALVFGGGLTLGILAGLGLKLTVDAAELDAYRHVARRSLVPQCGYADIDPSVGVPGEILCMMRALSPEDTKR